MPRKADEFVNPSKLSGKAIPDHDGIPVTETRASLVKTGHGLEETLRMAAMHIPMGAKVMVLVPARCTSHEYDFITEKQGKETVELEEYAETAVLEAEGCIFLDPDLVGEVVKAHNERVQTQRAADEEARRRAKGEFKLPMATAAEGAN